MKVLTVLCVCLLVVARAQDEDEPQEQPQEQPRQAPPPPPQLLQRQSQKQQPIQYEKDYSSKNSNSKETTTWIPILKYNKEQSEDGSYKTNYETGNNIIHQESGYLKDFSDAHPNGVLVQSGQYSYESPDGQIVNVEYTADENGFRATGDHIPTPPPVPEEIQKGLDQIYAGIKLNQQRAAERAKTDPDFAKRLEERSKANANGQYISEDN